MQSQAGRCRLGGLLKARKWKVKDFGERTGIKPNQLTGYIQNRHVMSLPIARTIALALNISIEELYDWDDQPTEPGTKKE